jgi:hypothetical protein
LAWREDACIVHIDDFRKEKAMSIKRNADAMLRSMEGDLRLVGKRLDVLAARARVGEGRLRSQALVQMKKLKVKQAQAKVALGKLAQRSGAAGGTAKAAVRRAWKDIDAAVARAARRLQAG